MQCLVPVAPDSSSYRVWFFYYLCPRNPRAVALNDMKILIDNGHGSQTKGKRSPDGTLLEYAYTRELARQIVSILQSRGYDSELLVPEDDDIPLSEIVRRTNAHCQSLGKSNVILISLHINAAGDGTGWHTATGWSCYTCKGQTESGRLADCLYKAAEQILKNQVIRTDYVRDGDADWEENFYILRKLHAQQYSVKTISWITNLILSICRAESANKPSSTPTSKASSNIYMSDSILIVKLHRLLS